MTIHENYSPMTVGDTGRPFAPVFEEIDPNTGRPKAFSLSGGLTITMRMKNVETGEVWDCAGTWTIDSAADGQAHYDWTEEDVGEAGIYELQITLTDSGGKLLHSDKKRLVIEEPL